MPQTSSRSASGMAAMTAEAFSAEPLVSDALANGSQHVAIPHEVLLASREVRPWNDARPALVSAENSRQSENVISSLMELRVIR